MKGNSKVSLPVAHVYDIHGSRVAVDEICMENEFEILMFQGIPGDAPQFPQLHWICNKFTGSPCSAHSDSRQGDYRGAGVGVEKPGNDRIVFSDSVI